MGAVRAKRVALRHKTASNSNAGDICRCYFHSMTNIISFLFYFQKFLSALLRILMIGRITLLLSLMITSLKKKGGH